MPVKYAELIEMPVGLVLEGSMVADAYEVNGVNPTNLIRTDQDWGVKVQWELRSLLAPLLSGEWRIQGLLERIGRDTPPTAIDHDLPVVKVHYHDGAFVSADHQMLWKADVKIAKGSVSPGTYKLVTVIQLYDDSGKPTAICGMGEQHGMINVFDPG